MGVFRVIHVEKGRGEVPILYTNLLAQMV